MAARAGERKAPKPRGPGRARGTKKGGAEETAAPAPGRSAARSTIADVAARVGRLAETVERIERALAPQARSADVAAEEHALLNLLDAIVDRRTEALLLPVARLAAHLERAAGADETDRGRLLHESLEGLADVVAALGLERIAPARGDAFEPMLHEEVAQVRDEEVDDGLVAQLLRAGYRVRGGRVLLPARVAVSLWAER